MFVMSSSLYPGWDTETVMVIMTSSVQSSENQSRLELTKAN